MGANQPAFRAGESPQQSAGALAQRVGELRLELRNRQPGDIARLSQAEVCQLAGGSAGLRLPVWGRNIDIDPADFKMVDQESGTEPGVLLQALILYHLVTTDGTALKGQWIAFSELPDGRFYSPAYQGYTGAELARHFGDDAARFGAAALQAGGRRVELGEAAFAFQLLPRVNVAAVCWLGDEDFPSSYQVLFDAGAAHHLPVDACAIAGSMLTRRLLNAV
jgi:hypothetical protein